MLKIITAVGMAVLASSTSSNIPTDASTAFKSWMPHSAITSKLSKQYEMQQIAYTDVQGFRRLDDDYMVAMGTYYSKECGKRFEIELEDDVIFTVVVSDIKNDKHTDKTNQYFPIKNSKGELVYANVLEFIIDKDVMDKDVLSLGDISSLGFEGEIIRISEV